MKVPFLAGLCAVSVLLAPPAVAQILSPKVSFINAVKERDALKVNELLRGDAKALLNTRAEDGSTPLTIVIGRQDEDWTGFFINKGANVDLAGKGGDTPLITAARVGFADAANWLISKKARIDATNRMGETALIVAVQQRQIPIVKLLLNAGADPDKADSAAGLSARDYAKRDSRGRQILQLIEAKKPHAGSFRL